ncbi:MAG: DUF6056 family protein [Oscillospiraceae bacterium]|jgi:hypothetical protein|nr:DUF6056 family protein [Oscillospiraceae bacterium]
MPHPPRWVSALWIRCARVFAPRYAALASILGLALVIAPLLLAAPAAFPAADDFVYATRTHQTWVQLHSLPHVLVDAWRYAAQIYRTWQGTFTGALVMSLHPAVFSLSLYALHVPLLLALWLAAAWALTRAACGRCFGLSPGQSLPAFAALAAAQWLLMPDLQEGLFWYNSAWLYTFAHAVLMATVALALRMDGAPHSQGWRPALRCVALCLLCAFLGMSNFITATLGVCLLGLLLVCRQARGRRAGLALLPAWLLLAAGLAASALAPGNAVRLATDGRFHAREPWLWICLLDTLAASARLWARLLAQTPVGGVALAAGLWVGCRAPRAPRLHPLLAAGLAFALLAAMMFPHMYTSGFAGTPRVQNLYFCYIAMATAFVAACAARALRAQRPARRPVRWAAALAALLVTAQVLTLGDTSYRSLAAGLLDGRVTAYRAEMQALFGSLAALPPGSDAAVPPIRHGAPVVQVLPLTDDPAAWRNVAVADYFGLASARTNQGD